MGAIALILIVIASLSAFTNGLDSVWSDFVNTHDQFDFYECVENHYCNATIANQVLVDAGSTFTVGSWNVPSLCECSLDCQLYGTCCIDFNITSPPSTLPDHECVSQYTDPTLQSFYAIVSCPVDYPNSVLVDLCETPIKPLGATPGIAEWFVTSGITDITYRNVFCGLCNNEISWYLNFWPLDIQCDTAVGFEAPILDSNYLPPNQTEKISMYRNCSLRFELGNQQRCLPYERKCQPSFLDEETIALCSNSPQALIKANGTIFKNIYCALCNGHSIERMTCPAISVHPFGGECEEWLGWSKVDSGACDAFQSVQSSCWIGELYDWHTEKCISWCGESLIWNSVDGTCALPPTTNLNEAKLSTNSSCDDWVTPNQVNLTWNFFDSLATTDHVKLLSVNETVICVNCTWVRYNVSIIEDQTNDSITIQGKTFHKLFAVLIDSSVAICQPDTTSQDSRPDSEDSVQIILNQICSKLEGPASIGMMAVSLVFLLVMIICYATITELQNIPGYMTLSKVVALMLAYTSFLLRLAAEPSPRGCYLLSVTTHYFFLASYFWTLLFSVEVLQTISAVYRVNQKSTTKFLRYSAIGWSIPLIPILIAIIMDQLPQQENMAPDYGLPQCWLNNGYGLYIYFIIPIAIIFVANFILYTAVIIRFIILSRQTSAVNNSDNHDKIFISVRLIFGFGLLWVFGLLSAVFPKTDSLSCIFIFVNGLSGPILFLVFLCNGKVVGLIRSRSKWMSTKSTSQATKSSRA